MLLKWEQTSPFTPPGWIIYLYIKKENINIFRRKYTFVDLFITIFEWERSFETRQEKPFDRWTQFTI